MQFKELSIYLEKLENTTARNDMVEILSELLAKADIEDIGNMMYLLQGRVAPIYVPLQLGMADKMVVRSIDLAYGLKEGEAWKKFKELGDIGLTAEFFAVAKAQTGSEITVSQVYEKLKQVAQTAGEGSVEVKIQTIAELLRQLDPLSARFVVRIPVGRLRLGFSDMTVLDSLSWMISGDKSHRKEIERAFNAHPDLGFIVTQAKKEGIEGLAHVQPEVFNPILMARAERLSSGDEIIEKIGACAVEPKFDGFRLQAHLRKDKNGAGEVKLFTRNLEEVTFMYPDVVAGILAQIDANEAIFEGEAIAYNPESGEYLPFQETVQRKRKYNIEEMAQKIPLKMICFDLLYLNGNSLLDTMYLERREQLAGIIKKGEDVLLSEEMITETGEEIENIFDDAISRGLEGIMAKKLDGVYQAGARGWNWIKFKRSYSAHLDDTLDCLVMGFNYGQGKRTSFGIGAFLIGAYDEERDQFVTVAKIGTGLTDEEWKDLAERGTNLKADTKPPLYVVDKALEPDVWIEPEIVVEIKADEITRSPIHTAGRIMKASKSGSAFDVDVPGYALRFPRLVRFRTDRKPEDTTTLQEVSEMFQMQGKRD